MVIVKLLHILATSPIVCNALLMCCPRLQFTSNLQMESLRPWSILKNESSTIQFRDSGSEIVTRFLVSDEQASSNNMQVTFLDFDTCNATALDQHFNFSMSQAYRYGDGLSGVDVSMSLNKDSIANSSAWKWQEGSDDTAVLAFCTRVDLIADDGFDMTYGEQEDAISSLYSHSVSYVKVLYNVTIVMSNDFYLVVDVNEEDPTLDQQSTTVDYTISACQCDIVTKKCLLDPQERILKQNSLLNVCIQADEVEDVVISDIIDFTMRQHDLAVTFISGDAKNALTSVVNLGTRVAVISAQLLSMFFESPAPIVLEGAAILRFAETDNVRQLSNLRASKKSNDPAMREDTEGTFGFTIDLEGEDDVEKVEVPVAMAANSFFAGQISFFAVATALIGLL